MRTAYWLPAVLGIIVIIIVVGIVMIPPVDQSGQNQTNTGSNGNLTEGNNGLKPPTIQNTGTGDAGGETGGSGVETGIAGSPDSATGAEMFAGGVLSASGVLQGNGAAGGDADSVKKPSSDPTGLKGVVNNAQGNPLGKVQIKATGADTVATDLGGNFHIQNLTGETVTLTLEKEGYQNLQQENVAVGTDDLKLVMVKEGALAGRVINQNNEPIPLAKIHIQATEGIWIKDIYADQNGRFEVADAPDGRVTITASMEGFEDMGEASREVDSPSGVEVVLRLKQPMFSISGRVVRQDNQQGVSGFHLMAKPESSSDPGLIKSAVSDGNGFYRIENTPRGTFIVSSAANENSRLNLVVPMDQDYKTVRIYDAEAKDVNFEVVNGAEVNGTVVTEGGQPVGGAEVYIARLGAPRTMSAANGTFRLSGVPVFSSAQGQRANSFSIQVFASHEQYGSGSSEPVNTETGGRLQNIQVVLKGSATLNGTVVDGQGAGVAGAQIVLQDRLTGQTQETQSDPSGAFVFSQVTVGDNAGNPMQGTHSVEAFREGSGRTRQEIVVRSGQQNTVTLTLDAAGFIAGRATDPSGKGVAGAIVTAWVPQGNSVTAQTDPVGLFRLESLPAGEYDLSFRLDGQPPLTGQLYRVPAGSQNADVMMTPSEWYITGTVFDQTTGQPVRQMTISVQGMPLDPNGRPFITSKVFNTPDGTYQIIVHEPGQYVMTYSAIGYQTEIGKTSVSPSYTERQFVNINLQPIEGVGGISGQITPPPGFTLAAVEVVGHDRYQIVSNNSFVLENIPSGRHDLLFYAQKEPGGIWYSIGGYPGVFVTPNEMVTLSPITSDNLYGSRN